MNDAMIGGPPSNDGSDFATVVGFRPSQRVGNNRYVLKQLLGQGGMGVVWLAHDETLGEDVALKFLPPQIRFDPTALDDLRRETLRSRKLTHPNIIRIHDLFEAKDQEPFISMEYVNGPTLSAQRLQMPGRVFQWDFLAHLVKQLCEALEYAHSEGIVHRDLKPSNLMLDSRGRLKLADFGIARVVTDSMSRVSAPKETSGTLVYMSPQQVDGKPSAPTDDLYSLGAALYELLSSKPPFYTGDIPHQVRYITPEPLTERIAALGLSNPVPPAVEETISACLAKDPAQRPHNARELAGRMGLVETKPPTTRTKPLAPDSAPLPRSDSRKTVWAGALAVLLVGAGATAYFLYPRGGAVPTETTLIAPTNRVARLPSPPTNPPVTPLVVTATPPPIVVTQVVAAPPDESAKRDLAATEKRLQAAQDQARQLEEERDRLLASQKARQEAEAQAQKEAEARHKAEEAQRLASLMKYPGQNRGWTNSLGMIFKPVADTEALFSIWETRYQDFEAFAKDAGYSKSGTWVRIPGLEAKPDHPIVQVSWTDAQAFCQWLTGKERAADRLADGQSYRLPTDVEWSRAAGLATETGTTPAARSSGVKKLFPWGDAWPPPPTAGNYPGKEIEEFPGTRGSKGIPGFKDAYPLLAPVGSFAPSTSGLLDLGGNVWEWCADWFNTRQQGRTLRGGAWDTAESMMLLSSFRHDLRPGIRAPNVGFRCVLAVTPEPSK